GALPIRLAGGSARAGRLRGTVVNAVEQVLERAARLRAECGLRPEEEQLPLPYARLGDCHTVLEVLLAPGPPAAQRCRGIEVRDRRDAVARDAERGAVAVYDDRALAHAVCERVVLRDRHFQQRRRHVELRARQILTVLAPRGRDRQAEVLRESRRGADGQDRAAVLEE